MMYLLALLMILSSMAVSARPILEIPNEKFDFGNVAANSTVCHYFWFKSTGADTVKVDKIKTGCTCALMPLERDWIAPGDSMKVGIFWNLKNQIGKTGRYPYILSNAGTDPINLHLTATVVTEMDNSMPVSVKPFRIELATTATTTVDSVEFVLSNRSDRDYTLTIVSFPIEQCEVVVPEKLRAMSEARCFVRLKQAFADKEFKGSVTIAYLGVQPGRVSIPVRFHTYGSGAN